MAFTAVIRSIATDASKFRRAPWGQRNHAGRWQDFGVYDLSTILERFKGGRHWRCAEKYTACISQTREDCPPPTTSTRFAIGYQTQ
jgi:hypothetical protein